MTRTSNTKRAAVLAIVAVGLVAAGCDSDKNRYDPDKPLDKMTTEEWCNFYTYYLTNPNLSQATRASAAKQMRARNCPNRPA